MEVSGGGTTVCLRYCHGPVYLKMVKMANFMGCVFHPIKRKAQRPVEPGVGGRVRGTESSGVNQRPRRKRDKTAQAQQAAGERHQQTASGNLNGPFK